MFPPIVRTVIMMANGNVGTGMGGMGPGRR